jgi:hypothetical protein
MRYVLAIILASLAATRALAADVAPSDASIRELLETTHARAMLEGVSKQVDASTRATMAAALKGQTLNDEQKKIMGDMQDKMTKIMRGTLDWDSFAPMIMKVYHESFSQAEVDGMLKFYKTPAGQAVINKMPTVMQNTMQEMQGRMQTLLPQITALEKDTAARLKAAATPKDDAGASAPAPGSPAAPAPHK